ncbi:MAG TPA: hypothetical protein VH206_18515 [Xanthobacteraceae bacterium]|jgi:hypothetical protein|nr:hypothetical protein [Xanthobacteraceae bacterium]
MAKVRARAQKRRQSNNRPRQVLAVLVIGATLGFAAFGTDAYIIAKRKSDAAKAAAANTVVVSANDDEIYTGSILFTADMGPVCHQLLFNNQNGQFFDNGSVDCERAAYRGITSVSETSAKYWPVARVQVISDGFRSR